MAVTADFLLELRSEEIPARMQSAARNALARLFAAELDSAGLSAQAIDVWSTPRRLAMIARALPLSTEPRSEELKGPRTSAPPQALDGFLRKTGLSRDQLEDRDGTWFATIDTPGQGTRDLLGPMVERIVADFPWPKAMRWGEGSLRWVRPLHGIVAMLGEEIVPVTIAGIASGATTLGHRFHHPGPITLGGPGDYLEKLRACHVIVDQDEREAIIRSSAARLAADEGLELVADERLVVENAGLTEWPVPLLGRFDPDYLDVPREVVVLTMRTNQKYFACTGDEGALAAAFVCVANIDSSDGGAAIVDGNRRVLAARLADARFFWDQDLKVPLDAQASKLSGIVFHERLGTLADKVERVARLARWLAGEGVVPGADPDQAERAARLAKADLVTGMVGEFPELQGVIGGYIAERQGEPEAIAAAIRDHYKPAGQGDEVPTAPVTVAVSLADKLDSLFAFFAAGILPTGSKDPFALRRSALGAIAIIRSNRLRADIGLIARTAWPGTGAGSPGEAITEFFVERLKVALKDEGVRHDLIAASTAWNGAADGRIDRVEARAAALQAFVDTPDGADLLAAYKRSANILKKEDWQAPSVLSSPAEQGIPQTGEEDPLVLVEEPGLKDAIAQLRDEEAHSADLEPAEQALVAALDSAEPRAAASVAAEDFTAAMAALASLRGPIDAFFDQVTVNVADGEVRARRLNLLARFRDAVHRVADFSRIEG